MKQIYLGGKNGTLAGRSAFVSDEDYELVAQHRWCVASGGRYAATAVKKIDGTKTLVAMHTMLTGFSKVDHINHNGLDNQRSNLREASTSDNAKNKRKKLSASSRFKGVSWDSSKKRWRVLIKPDSSSSQQHLGYFKVEELAAKAYDDAARKLYGEFAALNFPFAHEQKGR